MQTNAAARMADTLRRELLAEGESFIFETVFPDPVGDKIAFLKEAERCGYTVVLFFIGVKGPEISNVRVYDNSDLGDPYRLVATRQNAQNIELHGETPEWLRVLLP